MCFLVPKPEHPPGCLYVVSGLVWLLNNFKLGEERQRTAVCACDSCQITPRQELVPCAQQPQKRILQCSILFSLLLPISVLKAFQAYKHSSRNFLLRLLLAVMTAFFVFPLARCETCFDLFSHYENTFIYDAQQGDS